MLTAVTLAWVLQAPQECPGLCAFMVLPEPRGQVGRTSRREDRGLSATLASVWPQRCSRRPCVITLRSQKADCRPQVSGKLTASPGQVPRRWRECGRVGCAVSGHPAVHRPWSSSLYSQGPGGKPPRHLHNRLRNAHEECLPQSCPRRGLGLHFFWRLSSEHIIC